MRSHYVHLFGGKASGLVEYRVGNSDLAHVMEWSCAPDQLCHSRGESGRLGKFARELPHPDRVSAGLIVAYLGSASKALDDLHLRLTQIACSLVDAHFECGVLLFQRAVQKTRFQQVVNAKKDFRCVERLRQKSFAPSDRAPRFASGVASPVSISTGRNARGPTALRRSFRTSNPLRAGM